MFRVVPPLIVRSANNCIYSIWYLSHRHCYLPLSWKSWNRFECAVGVVRHPQHTQTGSKSSTIAAGSSNGVTNTRCCRYSCMRFWWWVVVSPETCRAVSSYNKLCNVSSCRIHIGIHVWNLIMCYTGNNKLILPKVSHIWLGTCASTLCAKCLDWTSDRRPNFLVCLKLFYYFIEIYLVI